MPDTDPLLAKYGATPVAQPQAADPLLAKYGAVPVAAAPPPAAPETPWYDKQLVHPETWFDDAKDADANTIPGGLRHVIHGALASAGALTSPKNLSLTAALVAANAVPGLGEAADAYALSSGLVGGGMAAKSIYDKVKAGDIAGAEETGGEALPGLVGTAYGAQRLGQRLLVPGAGLRLSDSGPGSGIAAPITAGVDSTARGAAKLASGAAESALNIRPEDRAYLDPGQTIGQAILNDTKGLSPKAVKTSGRATQTSLGLKVGQGAQQHAASGGTVSLTDALNRLDGFTGAAYRENDPSLMAEIDHMKSALTKDTQGSPIPSDVPAPQALSLLKGFRRQFASYRPDAPYSFDANLAAKDAAHDLSSAINDAMPDVEPLRDRMSSLYPVTRRADMTDRSAPIEQKFFDKLKANTGVLSGGFGIGAGAGFLHGGPVESLLGGGIGLVSPILLSHPNVQLSLARSLLNAGKGLNWAAPYVGDTALKLPVAVPPIYRTIEPTKDEDDQY